MWKNIAVAVLAASLLLPAKQASALENEDLLALVAMPLAVAAVSEMSDVPVNELMDVVTLMNDAAVPPPQFLEVVRYVPVALVAEQDGPRFVESVRERRQEGTALVTAIEEQLRLYDIGEVDLAVTRPRVIDVTEDFFPKVVTRRLAEIREHPHGGPPGQLKKVAGVPTGAEIVHGVPRRADRHFDRDEHLTEGRKSGKPDKVRSEKKSGKPGHAGGRAKGPGKEKG